MASVNNSNKTYTVSTGQSLFDVAVTVYGDVSGVAWLLADNKTLNGPTDRISDGQKLVIRAEAINLRARVFLEDYPVIATIGKEDMSEGIGFWRLDEYVVR